MAGAEVRLIGFHHVQLAMPSGEEARAEAFYVGILGLETVEKPDSLRGRGGCWFGGAGVEVHLGVEDPFRPARKAHPAFLVEGLEEIRRRVEQAGIEVEEQPPLPGFRRFHTFDPFGNRLEVLERAAET
jgi:catechol 2,3-dioxygenase-like lactoylglutathione lyase family enzyme